jgi:hypothetical protein
MMKRPFTEATLQLSKEDLRQLAGLQIGSKVHIILNGNVKEMRQSSEDVTEDGASSGAVTLNVSSMKIAGSSEVADLFEEELDG